MLLCFSWQEISPLTSGRLSHSSGPLNCLTEETDSPPVSPSEEFEDVVKVIINNNNNNNIQFKKIKIKIKRLSKDQL